MSGKARGVHQSTWKEAARAVGARCGPLLAALVLVVSGWAAGGSATARTASGGPPAAGAQPAQQAEGPAKKTPTKKAPAKTSPDKKAPDKKEPDKTAPEKEDPEHSFLRLQYRSRQRAEEFVDTAILREILSRDYQPEDGETVTSEAGVERTLHRFTRQVDADTRRSLGLALSPFPGGGFELYLFGTETRRGKAGEALNPDLAKVLEGLKALRSDLEAGKLGGPNDRLLEYPLSYVQADRAVAILRSLGYPAIEYAATENQGIRPDKVFDGVADRKSLSRPAIINLLDSDKTTLVGGGTGVGGSSSEPGSTTLSGGQTLGSVTAAVPQQRLLIVWDRRDPKSLDELLLRLEEDIDVAARQILIEALVIEVDHDRLREIGFSFSGSKNNSEVSFEEQGGVTQPFTYVWQRPAAETFLRFMGSLRALADRGEATVLSRPSVLVLDGRQARIKVADEVPFTASIEQTASGFTTIATKFLTAGIILNLRPRSTFDREEVSMQVETIISSAEPSRVLPDTGIVVAPKVQSREVQTLVRVANDTPFVIGGLLALTRSDQQSGVPGAMRWKWLGRLFRKENVVRDRKEVIVVITPHIVPEDDRSLSYTIPRDADIFDSFGTDLFRNVYRLRTSDIFDHSFVTASDTYKSSSRMARELAQELSGAPLEAIPDVGREKVRGEVKKRLSGIVADEAIETFLTLFEGDVPAEEILVHRMLLQLLEKDLLGNDLLAEERAWRLGEKPSLSFDDYVPIEKLLVIGGAGPKAEAEYDLEFLVQDDDYERCGRAVDGEYLRIAFPEPDPSRFAPPAAEIACKTGPLTNDNLISKLKKDYEDGTPAIYLSHDAVGRRKPPGQWDALPQTPEQLLQSVLALERLLELNPEESLPRTLQAFHPGREVVFPTREDLEERTYVLSRTTALLFYETLDFYQAFKSAFTNRVRELRVGLALHRWFRGWSGWRDGQEAYYREAYLSPPATAPARLPSKLLAAEEQVLLDGDPKDSKRLRVDLAYLAPGSCELESRELRFVEVKELWKIDKETPGSPLPCPAALRERLTAGLPPPAPEMDPARTMVEDWADAWSNQEVDQYLAFYSSLFAPASGSSRWEWSVERRRRLLRPNWISVDVDHLELEAEGPQRALARFVQTYRSNLLCDVEHKHLSLRHEEAGWKITAESTVPGKRKLCRPGGTGNRGRATASR